MLDNEPRSGTHGVYDMTTTDHTGVDSRSSVLAKVENGAWNLMQANK